MLDEAGLRSYRAAREGVAVMDRSQWGRVRMAGEDRIDFLHRLSTNEVRDLAPGMTRPTIFTSDIGRIVAVATACAFPDHLLLVADPGGAERIAAHLRRYIFFRDKVRVADATAETGMLSLWGPQALAVMRRLAGPDLAGFASDLCVEADVGGVPAVVAAAGDLTAAGFNVIVARDGVDALLRRFVEAGAQLMDATVYRVLRVEAGYPLLGREVGEEFNPLEAGLQPIISFTKGCYIGQEVIARLDTYDKVQQRLVGVRLGRLPAGEARPALIAVAGDGQAEPARRIGFLTSWVDSPAHGPIALGYVHARHWAPHMALQAEDAEGRTAARVVDLPFS